MSTTALGPTQQLFVSPLPQNPTTGSITVSITGELGNEQNPLTVGLTGSGSGWTTSPQGLQLTATGFYQFTFQMASASPYTLRGIQIYYSDNRNSNTERATIFFPVPSSSTTAEVNLLHDIQSGSSVSYQMFVGVQDAQGNTFWPDPTISFDPQG